MIYMYDCSQPRELWFIDLIMYMYTCTLYINHSMRLTIHCMSLVSGEKDVFDKLFKQAPDKLETVKKVRQISNRHNIYKERNTCTMCCSGSSVGRASA